MALIYCPECGKEISDQSIACIYCGHPILHKEGAQQVEITGVNLKSQGLILRKTPLLIGMIGLLACVVFLYQKNKEFNLEKLICTSYGEIVEAMISAELTTGLTHEVWSSAINESRDFSVALKELYSGNHMVVLTSSISKAGESVESIYVEILKKEDINSNLYVDYMSLYNQFKKIVRFSLSPEGSLLTYGQERRKLFEDYRSIRDKLSPRIHKEATTMNFWNWLVAKYK